MVTLMAFSRHNWHKPYLLWRWSSFRTWNAFGIHLYAFALADEMFKHLMVALSVFRVGFVDVYFACKWIGDALKKKYLLLFSSVKILIIYWAESIFKCCLVLYLNSISLFPSWWHLIDTRYPDGVRYLARGFRGLQGNMVGWHLSV